MLIVLLLLFLSSAFGVPSLVFRLDDLQCGWEMDTFFIIMDIFIKYHIPLTIGVITGEGDCYQQGLLQRYAQANGTIEVASHSVNHNSMTSLSYDDQFREVSNSKKTLEALIGTPVRSFIPPFNIWNYDTTAAVEAAGYDIFSAQCTSVETFYPYSDNYCSSNMYLNRPAFFPRIDGLSHAPSGAAISSFANYDLLVNASQLFYGTVNDCFNSNICSVQTQLTGMASLSDVPSADSSWSVVMMHPQNFPAANETMIEAFFAPFFPIATANYQLMTLSQLVGPAGSRPIVTGMRP